MVMEQVSFTQMKDGTKEDYLFLQSLEHAHHAATAERILREMRFQAEETLPGYPITRLEHVLQSATRAYREGADLDWVVATLLHDIGDGLAPQNHDRFAAEVLRPFVREEVTWVVENHGVFQIFYYGHHMDGCNQNERDKHKGHPSFDSAVDFCERWDQSSFDPDYDSEPLEFFEDMVREVFARKAYDPAVLQPGNVRGLPPLENVA
jgi:predicted HD phosphohydrolase